MENNSKISSFLADNWSVIVGVLSVAFIAGGVVSEFRLMRAEIEELKKDTSVKIQQIIEKDERKKDWLEEQEQRIDDLEEYRAYEDGINSTKK
jgi:hypothetical protein